MSCFLALEQVQRSLAAPVPSKIGKEVQTAEPQTVTAAPALSRALARVLGATESKENEAERRRADSSLDEEAGKTQLPCDFTTSLYNKTPQCKKGQINVSRRITISKEQNKSLFSKLQVQI